MPAPGRRGIAAWCLYDWASSAFNTVIGTFVFSVYFARSIYGDPAGAGCAEDPAGSALWGYVLGISGLAVAIASPILGAIADRGGRRKPWLGLFVALTVVSTALLWFAEPDRAFAVYALVLVAVASIAFELSGVFYNAMLPDIAPAGMVGRISGWGWGLGYAGGLSALALSLFGFVGFGEMAPLVDVGTERAENLRATAPLVAVWFAVFALPLFLLTPDRPGLATTPLAAVREGLALLGRTIASVRRLGNVLRFLIASALYRDGLTTLFAVGGLYAACTMGMDFAEIIVFAIGLNVTAGLGAAGFAWLDDGMGSKKTIVIALMGLIAFGIPLLLVTSSGLFIGLALGLGIFVGPAQAASRSLMAKLAPPDAATEFFGLYALTGKAAAFAGPILFAVLTDAFASQRAGMTGILALWVAGGALLLTVREPGRG
ncbi:MAG: MFS transporter [Rhodospirillaceae bacterium]|nr:MFS transporter [Rhodospirillaceae bacterium]